ncbi:transcription antitermination factor NusB [Streptococcus sp. DD13]|uniref:transcription antitermination factor NusB n=1 Tax=Streptococcus sp. DD13 TaxID=1777881 RepID=UPI0007990619|nr:transcription antitermination factor NusB [Streptococcus sp. DD13]KXT78036.1 Transcription termination protein NusB [Streptococcus sp. DD13]
MKANLADTRHVLRQRALQAILSIEYGQEPLAAARFAYTYDKEEEQEIELPLYLLNAVSGVAEHLSELDQKISNKLKAGWTIDRLTLIDKSILRLGLYEVLYDDETPGRVAVNEAVELAKEYSDEHSSKFINGILSGYIVD